MQLTAKNCFKVKEVNVAKTEGDFIVKPIIIVVDEMNEVMSSNDYRSSDAIKNAISSIARLGRAAACHLCLATQRPSGDVISSDLKNNISLATILGDFGTAESTLTLDDDYSANAKPEIKGRAFLKNGQSVIEYQSFFVDKDTTIFKKKSRFYNDTDSDNIIISKDELPDLDKHGEEAEMLSDELNLENFDNHDKNNDANTILSGSKIDESDELFSFAGNNFNENTQINEGVKKNIKIDGFNEDNEKRVIKIDIQPEFGDEPAPSEIKNQNKRMIKI